jgi:hypothetical protein
MVDGQQYFVDVAYDETGGMSKLSARIPNSNGIQEMNFTALSDAQVQAYVASVSNTTTTNSTASTNTTTTPDGFINGFPVVPLLVTMPLVIFLYIKKKKALFMRNI